MGGLLHFFDFTQGGTSSKFLTHKRDSDGLEAPRNSLELPIEAVQSLQGINETIPYSYQVTQHSLKRNMYPCGAPMKELIDKEMSKQTEIRHNVPSVVARLMGMDVFPTDMKPVVQSNERKEEHAGNNLPGKEQAENGPSHRSSLNQKQLKQDVPPQKRDPEKSRNNLKFVKPQPRAHPQEEQLQKFKKEFEAWQASKVWECSRSIELENNPRQWKDSQTLAQENLNKEKMTQYAYANRNAANGKPMQPKDDSSPATLKHGGLQPHGGRSEPFQVNQKGAADLRNKSRTRDFEQFPLLRGGDKHDGSSLSTRIVILKPGPERSDETEEYWTGSSERQEGNSIEDFLEEVKERLRLEMQGSVRRSATVRGAGVETPFSERPTNPKEIARHIAKHVRESVTRDLGMNLLRSESTRSYKSKIQFNGPGSPEFINRDTREFLSERLKNVLRNETNDRISGSSLLDSEGENMRSMANVSNNAKKVRHWENMKDETEAVNKSFRHEHRYNEAFDGGGMSPRNLVRSMSAPVSGTSFGKLLLEDPHVLTGGHIRRKLEGVENVPVGVRKNRKDRFSFRGKVSNLRHSLSLRGKLFGKKFQSAAKSGVNEFDPTKVYMTGPSVLMNFWNAQENSTEVPPSPASVCSSPHNEFLRPGDHPSPVSPLDVSLIEDNSMPQAFRDISSNLHELRRQLTQLHCDGSEDAAVEEDHLDTEMIHLESQAQVYVRDVLVAAGLYDASSTLTSQIDTRVFKEVEETYREVNKEGEADVRDDGENNINNKVLFDLLNEALAAILASSATMSRFTRTVVGPKTMVPRGKNLMDDVWRKIKIYVYPPTDGCHSLDGITDSDLRMSPWPGVVHDEMDAIGKEMEGVIVGELVEEVMRDMCC